MINSLVSIITPMYDSERFIESAIRSVQAQTYQNWEMVIIDDASKDKSIDIVRICMDQDKRIKLIALDINSGSAKARNEGLKISLGRYIAFLDSDDLWVPDKLKKQLIFMENNKLPITFTAYRKINENGEHRGEVNIDKTKISYIDLLKTNHIGCLTAMIDVKLLGGKIYMPLIRKRHDHAFWLSILKRGHIAYGLNEILSIYRIRKKSLSYNKLAMLPYQWKLYRDLENMSFMRSLLHMILYAWHGLLKWSL